MDEDIDIYGDLDDYGNNALSEKNIQQIKELENENNTLKAQLDEVLNLKSELELKFKNLEQNISTLLLTAKCEIDRKNETISQLRKDKDDVAFRRKRKVAQCHKYSQTMAAHSSNKAVQVDEDELRRPLKRNYSPERNRNYYCSSQGTRNSRHMNQDSCNERETKRYRYDSRDDRNRDNRKRDSYPRRACQKRVHPSPERKNIRDVHKNYDAQKENDQKLGEFIPRKMLMLQNDEIPEKINIKKDYTKNDVATTTDDSQPNPFPSVNCRDSPGKNDILCALKLQPTPRKCQNNNKSENVNLHVDSDKMCDKVKIEKNEETIVTTGCEQTNLDAALAQLNEESMNGFEQEYDKVSTVMNESVESSSLEIVCEDQMLNDDEQKLSNNNSDQNDILCNLKLESTPSKCLKENELENVEIHINLEDIKKEINEETVNLPTVTNGNEILGNTTITGFAKSRPPMVKQLSNGDEQKSSNNNPDQSDISCNLKLESTPSKCLKENELEKVINLEDIKKEKNEETVSLPIVTNGNDNLGNTTITSFAKSSPPMVSKRFLVERFEINGENNEPTLYLTKRKKTKKSKK